MKPFAIFSAFLLLLGCTGPEGPVGPPGPNLFSQVFEFEVDFTPSNNYEAYIEFPQEIEVFEADLILVFLAYETTDSNQGVQYVWRPLPQTIFTSLGLLQYQFDHTFSDMRVFVEADYSLTSAIEADLLNQRFKVGVIPAAYAQEVQGLTDLTDADFLLLSP
jgi:hypothetical protein